MKNIFGRKKIFGGIDIISPSIINGWVYCKDTEITKVGLFEKDNLIQELIKKLKLLWIISHSN